ncbi:class I SAM-dependent methyltransferase [Candidatus Woesearchaeota archaeon]|nr:class I SAM-dependent methyltransferase [Candidatus Woesearchaeota archaeon]
MEEKEWNKLASKYHEEIVSPFYGSVKNPLIKELRKIKGKKKRSVAEFGCGLFYLMEELKDFKKVHASDFAENMVKKAKKKNKYKHISIKREDMRKILYKDAFDIIISVNALLMPSLPDIKQSITNLHKALKEKGTLFLILPSMEAVLYHGLLILDNELKVKQKGAVKKAKQRFENSKYDLFLGLYKEGEEHQKFYYKHEIQYFLKKAGFTDISFEKVLYPWDKNASDYEPFPGEEQIWDWFVKATK